MATSALSTSLQIKLKHAGEEMGILRIATRDVGVFTMRFRRLLLLMDWCWKCENNTSGSLNLPALTASLMLQPVMSDRFSAV